MGASGRLRRLLFAGVAAIAAVVALAAYAADALEGLELEAVDLRFDLRGEEAPPDELVVVQIDDRTFSDLKEQWPLRRSLHARAIDRLRGDGARVIAYDVQFSERTPAAEDNALILALRRSPGVVLATTEVSADGRPNVLEGNPEALRFARAEAGNANYVLQDGGVIRRMPFEIDGLRAFSIVAAERAQGTRIDPSELEEGSAWIDFAGPPGSIPAVSFSRVLEGDFPPGTFRDKVVVLGVSAPSVQDVHATSTTGEEVMSGPEIQAHSIATALAGFPLGDAPRALEVLLILALALVVPLAALRLPALAAVGVALAAALLMAGGAFLAFESGTIVAVTYPLLALTLASAGSAGVASILGAVERERVRELFGRFVPQSVVNQVIHEADGARLGGIRREATILFCDIRGFTSYSETLHPAAVIDTLNRYLTLMSDEILDQGGTLVSYLGDGIMAVFGAPLDQPDHADRALAAARGMLTAIDRLNGERAQGEDAAPPFRIGIGLNTGSVMVGNVGSQRRLEYTAIGDAVNCASRLEGATKDGPHQLLLADSTRLALQREPGDLIDAGEVELRGRRGRMRAWSVPGAAAPAADAADAVR